MKILIYLQLVHIFWNYNSPKLLVVVFADDPAESQFPWIITKDIPLGKSGEHKSSWMVFHHKNYFMATSESLQGKTLFFLIYRGKLSSLFSAFMIWDTKPVMVAKQTFSCAFLKNSFNIFAPRLPVCLFRFCLLKCWCNSDSQPGLYAPKTAYSYQYCRGTYQIYVSLWKIKR